MDSAIRTFSQLGQALQAYRKKTSLTQIETAAKVGLRPKTISSLEMHPEKGTLVSLFKLLSALELELVIRPQTRRTPLTKRRKNADPSNPNKGEW
jgi:HTH-type transcriptional regulator / antitoxin HipB